MKPIKKDVPRQRRRERTLARLEAVLKGGVKFIGRDKRNKIEGRKEKLTPEDIVRINGEITTLKTRLGLSTVLSKENINDPFLKSIGV